MKSREDMSVSRELAPDTCAPSRAVAPRVTEARAAATTYRGWSIHYDPPPIPMRNCDWHYAHDDFDGAPDAGDNRCGHAPSLEAAQAEIDLFEDEK